MKPKSGLSFLLLLLVLFACSESNEILPEEQEQIKVLTRKELRTSYGHVSFDSLEYEGGRLSRKIYYHDGEYNSEKIFLYGENDIQMLSNNNGVLNQDPYQILNFDDQQRLQKVFYRNAGSWEFSYEGADILPSASTGSTSTVYTFDDSGNLVNKKFATPQGSYEYIIKYDNKINPYKKIAYFEWEALYFSENNAITYSMYHEGILEDETVDKYEYDQEGYPVKMVTGGDTILFFYSHIDLKEK